MSTSEREYGDPATRRQILVAAWALIEEGDTEVRLADVGARAGVSRRAVYLHFGDRAGLLAALVDFMDEAIGVREMAQDVWAVAAPEELLAAVVAFYAQLNPRVDAVARMLDARPQDAAAQAAWRSRMEMRRHVHRELMQRIRADHSLAAWLTVDTAADLVHAMMLPAVWRELAEIGWTVEECRAHLTTLLHRALLAPPASA